MSLLCFSGFVFLYLTVIVLIIGLLTDHFGRSAVWIDETSDKCATIFPIMVGLTVFVFASAVFQTIVKKYLGG